MSAFNLVIAYDLIRPGQNYDAVQARIKQLGSWYQLQYSLFYAHTFLTPAQAHAWVGGVMDANDRLAVINALSGVVTPLPVGHLNAINTSWFSDQKRALPHATAANG